MLSTERTERRAAKKIRQYLHHRGEALGGQIYQAGKKTALSGVDVDTDEEEQVHEMHPAVLVDTYEGDALQAGNWYLPQRKMQKEGVQPPASAILRRARCLVLADGPGMRREDRGQLGRD